MIRRPWNRCLGSLLVLLFVTQACGSGAGPGAGKSEARRLPYRLISSGEGDWRTAGLIAAGSPASDPDGDVIAVVSAADAKPSLIAFDAASGETLWEHAWNPSNMSEGMGVGGPVVIGRVVVGLEYADSGTLITGFDSRTGERKWSTKVIHSRAPIRCGDFVCTEELGPLECGGNCRDGVPTDGPKLVARDPKSGEMRWAQSGHLSANPSTMGLFIPLSLGPPAVSSIDPDSGTLRWWVDLNKELGAKLYTTGGWHVAAASPDTVIAFVGTADHDVPGDMAGLDAATGAIRWHRPNTESCFLEYEIVPLACNPEDGISLLDLDTGKDVWFAEDAQPPWGRLLGVSFDGDVLAFTEADEPIRIDRATGQVTRQNASDRDPRGWVYLARTIDVLPGPDEAIVNYRGPFDLVPWHHGNQRALEGLDLDAAAVPDAVGTRAAGRRAFVDASGELVALRASSGSSAGITDSPDAPAPESPPSPDEPVPTTVALLPEVTVTVP